jgi:ubiquinone biosynthesis protein
MTPLRFTRNIRSLNRLRQIARVLTRHGFGHIVTRIDLGRLVPVWMLRRRHGGRTIEPGESSVGRRLTLVAAELGPTFVKLGQMLSTRADILPPAVLDELRTLQDAVPPFDTAIAMQTIEEELGGPVAEHFARIDSEPFASASIGQVYRAKGKNDEDLVVKVRRPEIEETIQQDIQLLYSLAHSLESLAPELRVYRPVTVVSEFEQMLSRELDYVNEASTTSRFAEALAGDEGIQIPKVHWDLCGPRVLTLQAVPGFRLGAVLAGECDGVVMNRPRIARRVADCFLKQTFEVGFFHADPHPGNILVQPASDIGLVDFGQVGTITDEWRTELLVIVYAAVNKEIGVIVDAFDDMGALGRRTDRRALHRALQVLLDKYYGLPIKRFDLKQLLDEFSDVIRRHDLTIPRDLLLLIKAYSILASVTSALDPELDLLELLHPRLKKGFAERLSPGNVYRGTAVLGWQLFSILRQLPGQLRQGLRRLATTGWHLDVRHENIDRLANELDRSSNRLAFSVVIAAIIVGSSVVVSANTDLLVLGFRVQTLGMIGYLLAGVLGLALSWAIFRSGRLH